MDTGSKSLAQLSQEGKEKKFVTIEVGSKVSGYTQDYLERLCILNKVEYRLRSNGSFAVELESLLNETHTILLSYEGVDFIDKAELTEPKSTPNEGAQSSVLREVSDLSVSGELKTKEGGEEGIENAVLEEKNYSQPVPRFGDVNRLSQQAHVGTPFSFVGRSVISDGKSPVARLGNETHIPIDGDGVTPTMLRMEKSEAQDVVDTSPAMHIPILSGDADTSPLTPMPKIVIPLADLPSESSSVVAPPAIELVKNEPIKLEVKPDVPEEKKNIAHDKQVFQFDGSSITRASEQKVVLQEEAISVEGEQEQKEVSQVARPDLPQDVTLVPPTPQSSGFEIVSPYRPIQTSSDPKEHHDNTPLFPEISKNGVIPSSNLGKKVEQTSADTPVQSKLKVVVFDPKALTDPSQYVDQIVPKPSTALEESIIPRALPSELVPPTPAMPDTAHTPSPQRFSLTPSQPKVPITLSKDKEISARAPLSAMRVMPRMPMNQEQKLPMTEEEHHMLIREEHPLTTSKSLNIVFGLFVGASSLLLLTGLASGNLGFDLNTSSYVAGVGSAVAPTRNTATSRPQYAPSETILPFSNDVIVSTSSSSNSVVVTPVFPDGDGHSYRYEMIRTDDVKASTTTISQ